MRILVTGAAGYLGSHACVELVNRGFFTVGVENFANSSGATLDKVRTLCNEPELFAFCEGDVRDPDFARRLFSKYGFNAILHFAALKSVTASIREPVDYYDVNFNGTLNLVRLAMEFGVEKFIFSSTAAVYSRSASAPLTEESLIAPSTPYGKSKEYAETLLEDAVSGNGEMQICSLRYFNPVGCHPSALIGDFASGQPSNLFPLVCQVALGVKEKLFVYGNDYNTRDGTCIRDYIHVTDLVEGHLAALEKQFSSGYNVFNLGTGNGTTVLEVIREFDRLIDGEISYEIVARRPGDIPVSFTDIGKAHSILNWKASIPLEEMCSDSLKFVKKLHDKK